MSGLVTAVQFLTVLPVPGGKDLAAAVRWSPLVGLLLGLFLAGAELLLAPVLAPGVRAALLVALLAILTGALHLDGLADSADGLLAPRSPQERLAIMRDPRAGGFGVAAIAVALLVKFAALADLQGALRLPALIVVPALARWVIVGQGLLPPARPGGLGEVWRQGATPLALVVATIVTLVPAVLLLGVAGLVLALVAAVVATLVGGFALRRVGGVTGDALGATVELAEAACWVVACAL